MSVRSMTPFRAALAFVAVFCLTPAGPARAELQITPFAGALVPMRNLVSDTTSSGYFRMQTHTVYGVTFGTSLTERIGFDLTGGVGTGKMEILSAGQTFSLSSSLMFLDVRGRIRVAGSDDSNLALLGGVGYTDFNVGLFETAHDLDEDTNFEGKITGLVGLGFHSGSMERLRIAVDLMDRIHSQGIEAPGLDDSLIEKTQHDIMFTVGLSFPL